MVRLWGSKRTRPHTTINNYTYYGVHSASCTPATVTQTLPAQWVVTNTPKGNVLGLTVPSPAVSIAPLPNLGVVNTPAPQVIPWTTPQTPAAYSLPPQNPQCVPGTPASRWTPAGVSFPLPQSFTPVSHCSVLLDPLFTPVIPPLSIHRHSSPRSRLKNGRSRSRSKSFANDMLPNKKRPLHRNLIDIDWDLREPLSKAICWSRNSGSSSKLDKTANATTYGIEEIEIVAEVDDASAMANGTSGAIDALFDTSWGGALVAEARNGPLTVGGVLRVLQNFLYEALRPDELHYLYSLGLYQNLLDANADRVGTVGQWFSHGDIGKFRRIDLFGEFTQFKGFEVEQNEGDGLLVVKCLLSTA
ncbi:hypothetical protein EST38_g5785 [Candolleomyces aberdarensis]|uniref:Uncharacterized protein n=1 Tax=Candolleomyces aberdarensis TaxID=2316362 RepID=A0A4V1Q3X3_9AGAR|nr:hypothetical protein EST38_g5785 [Candolleomyces aberdarensis]